MPTVRLAPDLVRPLRLRAAERSTTVQALVDQAVRDLLARARQGGWLLGEDEPGWLWERCYECGHTLAMPSDSCPQCQTAFDGRPEPRVWPATCRCDRCRKGTP